MTNLPLFNRLDVDEYGLFPGRQPGRRGLHVRFKPGLTLILGTNGLGKTTLINILYRLLTGPFDIPGLTTRTELGTTSLDPAPVPTSIKRMFGQRVVDGAKNATAGVSFALGGHTIRIERRLRDLSLVSFVVDDRDRPKDEKAFQTRIARLAGVWSFGDWILLLRQLVFYFEDRKALMWDPSAQRQMLRLLLLSPKTAQEWTEAERAVLRLDSESRNLSAIIFREEQRLAEADVQVEESADVGSELESLQDAQRIEIAEREALDTQIVETDARRQAARLRFLRAEQEREARYRNLEHAKLTAIEARFPKTSDTARYILAQLLSESECLVCGNRVPKVAAELELRISKGRCVICGSDVSDQDHQVLPTTIADRRVGKAADELDEIEPELVEARRLLEEAAKDYNGLVATLALLDAQISQRSARIDALIRSLPPSEADLHRQRTELAGMRSRLDVLQVSLSSKRAAFGTFVDEQSQAMVVHSLKIQTAFAEYARGFLLEDCSLVWSPQRARLGQTGESLVFPAFELDMAAASFPSLVRRTGPEQVSESQREFIDLAFRMALIEVTANGGVGSLVIDAPEASLDAVFVGRAAAVLARFAVPSKGNRLAVTSNLIEGKLIPRLLASTSTPADRRSRVVDLFNIAAPTAAVREMRKEYERIFRRMIASAGRAKSPDARQ